MKNRKSESNKKKHHAIFERIVFAGFLDMTAKMQPLCGESVRVEDRGQKTREKQPKLIPNFLTLTAFNSTGVTAQHTQVTHLHETNADA